MEFKREMMIEDWLADTRSLRWEFRIRLSKARRGRRHRTEADEVRARGAGEGGGKAGVGERGVGPAGYDSCIEMQN